jgi:hypothetical protein
MVCCHRSYSCRLSLEGQVCVAKQFGIDLDGRVACSVALFQNFEGVAIARQLLEEIPLGRGNVQSLAGGLTARLGVAIRRPVRNLQRFGRPVRHDRDAESQFICSSSDSGGAGLCRIVSMSCNQPMEAKERTSVTERLVDIRYLCAACGMETKRTVAEEA